MTSEPLLRPVVAVPADDERITGRQWLSLAVLSFTVLLISLDQTVLNVALPTLIDTIHPTTSELPWIADGYTLTNAVLLLFGGALGDRFGRRRIFLVGLLIFGGGSGACALVHSTGPVIAARSVMGVGAALLMPATLSIIATTFGGHQRARAIGIWAGVSGIGTAAGPLLGGWLLQHFWWGSVFLINVPVAVVALVGGLFVVAESRADHPPSLNPAGVLLSSIGLAAVTYGLIEAPTSGWGSPVTVGSFGAGAALIVAFVLWDRRRDDALVDLHLFANRTFSSALGAVTAVFFAMFGVSYLLSQYIQFVQGADAFGVGLRFLPLAIGTLITSNMAAELTRRAGLRLVMLTGMILGAASLTVLTTLGTRSGVVHLGVAFLLLGLGMGLVVAPASNAIVGTLPPEKIGSGSGLRSMVQLLGGSFGVAIVGSLATGRYHTQVGRSLSGPLHGLPATARGPVSAQIGQALQATSTLPPSLARATTRVAQSAFVSGLRLSALVGVAVLLLASVAAAIYVPRRVAPIDHGADLLPLEL